MIETSPRPLPKSIDDTLALLGAADYVADRSLATVLFLALKMGRPIFLEGEAGVGKTEIAKVLAQTLGRRLIRLQCYEGLDIASAVYEWNYSRQMIEIRPAEPFEAYLLEVLSDFQITIPEIGTIKAQQPPIVVMTSNRTREIHDAVKRRCLYHWVHYPSAERELEILARKVPGAPQRLSEEVVAFVQKLRGMDLFKAPGVAETIDWSRALVELDRIALDPATIDNTLGALLKYQDDIARVQGSEAARLLAELRAGRTTPGPGSVGILVSNAGVFRA